MAGDAGNKDLPEGDLPFEVNTRPRPASKGAIPWPRENEASSVQARVTHALQDNPVMIGAVWAVLSQDPGAAIACTDRDPTEDLLYDLAAARLMVTCIGAELESQIPFPADQNISYSRAMSSLLTLEEAMVTAMQCASEIHQLIYGLK